MSSKERRFFSGDTLEQTVMQAARYHRVEPEELAYRKLEKRHGFLKVRRGVVIEVDPSNPRRSPSAPAATAATPRQQAAPPAEAPPPEASPAAEAGGEPAAESPHEPRREAGGRSPAPEPRGEREEDRPEAPEPSPPSAPAIAPERAERPSSGAEGEGEVALRPIAPRSARRRLPPATGEVAEAARRALAEICAAATIEVEAEVLQGEDRLEVELSGRDEDLLLEDDGALLLAIQHLLPRVIRGFADRSTACKVDCQDFHEIRQEKLRSLAQDVAAEVRRSQRSSTLDPMSPEERRIVHLTLVDDPEVTTQSQGSGFFKRVRIEPTRGRPQGFDPYDR